MKKRNCGMPSVGICPILPKTTVKIDGGKDRRDDEPERAEHRLRVARDEIAPEEAEDQVAIAPDFAEAQIEPTAVAA